MNYRKLGIVKEEDNKVNIYCDIFKLKRYLNKNNGVLDLSVFDINKEFNIYINGFKYKYKVYFNDLNGNIKLHISESIFEDKVVIERSIVDIDNSYFYNQLNVYNSNANINGTTIYNGMYATDNTLSLCKYNRFEDGSIFLKNNNLVMERNSINCTKYLYLLFNNIIKMENNDVSGYTYILSNELFNLSDFGSCSFNGINIDTLYMNDLNLDLYNKRMELINTLYELKYKLLELNNKEKEDICKLVDNNKLSKVLKK